LELDFSTGTQMTSTIMALDLSVAAVARQGDELDGKAKTKFKHT
jgi:hypothetical protein